MKPIRARVAAGFTLVEIVIVLALLGIALAIAVSENTSARRVSRRKSCQENLAKLDGAKEQLALEMKLEAGTMVRIEDIAGETGYLKNFPTEPSGYTYRIGAIAEEPACTGGSPGHSLSEIGIAITEAE